MKIRRYFCHALRLPPYLTYFNETILNFNIAAIKIIAIVAFLNDFCKSERIFSCHFSFLEMDGKPRGMIVFAYVVGGLHFFVAVCVSAQNICNSNQFDLKIFIIEKFVIYLVCGVYVCLKRQFTHIENVYRKWNAVWACTYLHWNGTHYTVAQSESNTLNKLNKCFFARKEKTKRKMVRIIEHDFEILFSVFVSVMVLRLLLDRTEMLMLT